MQQQPLPGGGGPPQRSLVRSRHGLELEGSSPSCAWAASPLNGFASLLSCLELEEKLPWDAEAAETPLGFSQDEELEEESTESELEPEPEPMKEEFDGVLTEDVIAQTLHNLGRSAPGTEYVFLNLSLPDYGLSNVTILSKYVHLQKLDLSYNKIDDLSCVSHMPYLLEMDVSHNELTTYFDFNPPKNLQIVNFSHNLIPEMRDLSAYQSLTTLILDNNNIAEIRGLENCHSLTYLSLANNRIAAITGLKNLPIKTLSLKSNQIEKAAGLEDLKVLRILDLSSNQISSLEGLEEHSLLEEINLEDNQVSELGELEYIENLPLLRVFNLLNNPVQQHADYWLLVIFMLLQLTELDHKKITVQEKVAAVNKYDPPPEVVAAQDHMTHIMYSMMQPQRIFDSTLPSLDAPYPMLVLTGPLACWKRELCHRLCRKFNNYFRYSPCHTTRAPYFGEENRLDYYFVSQEEFDKMVNAGKFIATFKYSGYCYGLGRDTIESIAREGLATCVHLEIEGVRSLKNSYFEPRYILLIPISKDKYEGHLRRKGLFSRLEISEALHRVDMYIRVNQDFPGFFDAVINIDDYDEAFTHLSRLIEEFLGLRIQPSESETTVPGPKSNLLSAPNQTVQKAANNIKGTDGVAPSPTPNEFLDSSARNYSSRISAKLSAQKTPVEEASLQRRQHTARQGLTGKATSSYSQLSQRDLASTPGVPRLTQPRFLEPASHAAPVPLPGSTLSLDRSFQPASPDQSTRESQVTTGLSVLSPGAFSSSSSSGRTPVAFSVPSADETNGEKTDGKELDLSAKTTEKKTLKPKSTSPSVPQVIVRPGSNTKPVLPPIPSGQKKTKPKPLLAESGGSSFLLSPKP